MPTLTLPSATVKLLEARRRGQLAVAALLLGAAASSQAATTLAPVGTQVSDTLAVGELVRKFTDAQMNPDPVVLRAITSEQFVEISPLGDVDPREKMIGFYIKDPARPASQLVIDEREIRLLGDSAVITLKVTMNANGQMRSIRSGYVAHKEGKEWKMVSAQHTPMRPPKP